MFEQIHYFIEEYISFIQSGTAAAIVQIVLDVFSSALIFLCLFFYLQSIKYLGSKYREEKQRAKDFEEAYDIVSEGYLQLYNKYVKKEEEDDSSV